MKNIKNITIRMAKIACFCCLALISGCAAFSKTDTSFHELADHPDRFNLLFDAYVIGVEKAGKFRVDSIEECENKQPNNHCLNINAYAYDERLQDEISDIYSGQFESTFVSHVAKFSHTHGLSKPCFLFNVYDQSGLCQGISNDIPEEKQYVSNSWNVLSELGKDISNDIDSRTTHPTHFIVYVMGWNTQQSEAMQDNYPKLFGSLTKAAEKNPEFRPVFLGITWPSTGFPTLEGADYGIKAKDADEVGMIWGNILVNKVLADLKTKYGIPIVVVGHSFGARATSRAVFSSPLISPDGAPQKNVDLLLGLQGAYSYQRYISGAGTEGSPYRGFSDMVGKAVLTSAEGDKAVKSAKHEEFFVGSSTVYEETKKLPQYFEHIKTDDEGHVSALSCDSSKIAYIDASSIIKKDDGGKSGAHSDIYNPAVGQFTFDIISKCLSPAGLNHKN